MYCLKCENDLSQYEEFKYVSDEIQCDFCGNKMIVDFDEEENGYFWFYLESV